MVRWGERPFTFEPGRVVIVLSSTLDAEELSQTMESVLAHPDFTPGRDVIFDVRGSDINPNFAEIKNMLATIHALSSEFSGRFAIIVSDSLRYGLARMASSLGSPLGMKMNAFYSVEEATQWLREEASAPTPSDGSTS